MRVCVEISSISCMKILVYLDKNIKIYCFVPHEIYINNETAILVALL